MKTPKPIQPQCFEVQLPDRDDESPPPLDLPLHRVNVGCSNRATKAYCQLTSNSMTTGISDKEEVELWMIERYIDESIMRMTVKVKKYSTFGLFCKRAPDRKCPGARLILSSDGRSSTYIDDYKNVARRQPFRMWLCDPY